MEQYANAAVSTLNGAITSGSTSLVVASAAQFPTSGSFRILVETEIMLVTAVSSNTFTIARAQEGTVAGSHNNGVIVAHVLTSGSLLGVKPGQLNSADANDIAVWQLGESASPFANTGSGSADNMVLRTGTPVTQASGYVLSNSLLMQATGQVQITTAIGAGTDSIIEPAIPLSISCWVRLLFNNSSGSTWHLIEKLYRPVASGWTSPFISLGLSVASGSPNTLSGDLTPVGGSNTGTAASCLSLGCWHHVGATWDGTTHKLYCDGTLVNSNPISGTGIDYGTHGPWIIGQNPASTGEGTFYGYIQDVRIANVLRSATYFRNVFRNALNLVLP